MAKSKQTGNGGDVEKPRRGARGLWNGAISFSLIHIPVSLHTAARAHELDLNLLDKRDFAPVGYQRYNKATGKVVEWNDVVKGYEYEKGEYVVLTDEDFRRANVEASRTIDIQTFVDRDAIAPYYFDTPYFLVPDKNGERVYALLREALEQSKKLAVATFVLRSRQHVAALMPVDKIIVLNTLRYEQEIQPHPEVAAAVAKKANAAGGRELTMALKLVDEMSEKWKPEVFTDTYRDDLLKRIQQKVKAGQTHTLTEPEAETTERAPAGGKVVDLMSLLQRSLDQKGGAAETATRATKRKHSAARRRSTNARAARRA
ncbi:MAG TPA: Ku protein [Steroidobacteraceae bacterium]